jgi:hypothetical protein
MDDLSLLKEKLDPTLLKRLDDVAIDKKQSIPVIIQTIDGIQEEDRPIILALGGKIKRDLHIINAFSVDISLDALPSLVLNPRIQRIFYDAQVQALL